MRKFEKISETQWLMDGFNQDAYAYIKLPKRATPNSAGYDLHSPISLIIEPGEVAKIPSGLKVCMDSSDVMFIIIRSSLGLKHNLSIPNQVGVIDSDYYNNPDNEGHFWICLKNNGDEPFIINVGDRISQAIFVNYNIVEGDEPLNSTRSGGFGSTGA